MRMYVLLIFTAIFLSFTTAYYAIDLKQKTIASTTDIEAIQKYKSEFVQKATAQIEIDLSMMYPSRSYAQLFSSSNVFSNEDSTSTTFFSKPCVVTNGKMSRAYFEKSDIWEDFRCNRIKKLPVNFFYTPPLIHESGVSFAYLAFLSGREPFYNQEWVRSNLNFFHVYELPELPQKSLEGNFLVLSKLKKVDLEALIQGSPFIITEDAFIVRSHHDNNITYKIYSKMDLENFSKKKYYFIKPFQEGEQCFYREGRFCWEKSSGPLLEIFMESSIIIVGGSIFIIFLIGVILFRKIQQQKFEEERKKHALRVLTHELRTPISNLLLQVERINKQSDMLPGTLLEDFLKMEGEVYRLKRLAEKSTSYLQTHDGPSLIAINYQKVSSINSLLRDMIDIHDDNELIFIPAARDQEFNLDVYWFSICVKNLIENALIHGKKPITIELFVSEDSLTLNVKDHGVSKYKNLDEILSLEKKGRASSGLGLGLSIVQKIMKEMDGRLSYSCGPVTFTLFLRNKK